MIDSSRQQALHAGKAAEIELTPEEEKSLEQLGYGGDAER